MPGWKHKSDRQLDALTTRHVPHVRKAVKWNSVFYGIEGQGRFLNFHCRTKYVKVAFFRGAALNPIPPGKSKDKHVGHLHIYENAPLDADLPASWSRQATALCGGAGPNNTRRPPDFGAALPRAGH